MTDEELIAIDTGKLSLREEAKNQGKRLLAGCVEGMKVPIKNYADAMISGFIDWVVDRLLERTA